MNNETKRIGWIDEIAFKSKCSIEDIKSIIEKYDIQQSPNIGTPRHLQIKELLFSGVKEGQFTNEFSFKFGDLKPGIYGLISDENLRGKTTVLEVIKWLLRGNSSSLFQKGVKNWIKKASLSFKIGQESYLVKVSQTENIVEGKLLEISGSSEIQVGEFFSKEEFESCMSEFMIRQFSLDKISAFHNSKLAEEVGKKINHNWSALSSTLFITTNYDSLFGDVVVDGLSNRLMNMYLGLPWVSTHTALKTIESQIKSENKVDEIHLNKENERKKKRYQEVILGLKEKEELIKTLPSDNITREKLRLARTTYGETSRNLTFLDNELRKLTEELELTKETWKNDKIRVNNFKEDKAANVVFKRLNPTCCPHCEKEIDKIKVEKEKTSHQCAICDSSLLESQDSEVLLKELEINLMSSEKAYKEIVPNRLKS